MTTSIAPRDINIPSLDVILLSPSDRFCVHFETINHSIVSFWSPRESIPKSFARSFLNTSHIPPNPTTTSNNPRSFRTALPRPIRWASPKSPRCAELCAPSASRRIVDHNHGPKIPQYTIGTGPILPSVSSFNLSPSLFAAYREAPRPPPHQPISPNSPANPPLPPPPRHHNNK